MKPICIIPARGGSKGVRKKNIKLIGGKPLIAYTIETCLDSKIFSHVIVSTEDKKIASIAKEYGAEVPFMRPKKLATNNATFDAVLIHAVKKLLSLGYKFDIVVSRDCTVPFIDKKDMKGTLNLLKKSNCDSVFSVCESHPNAYFGMFEVNSKGFLEPSKIYKKPIKRRQDAPVVYETNGLMIHYVKNLLKSGKMFTSKMLPYVISLDHGLMIDFEIQFQFAEFLYNKRLRKSNS